jgi:hypothetical protein
MMRRALSPWIAFGIALTGAAIACTLNPQPLPPDGFASEPGDDDEKAGGGASNAPAPPESPDAGFAADASGGGNRDAGADVEPVPSGDGGGDAPADSPVDAPLEGASDAATGG